MLTEDSTEEVSDDSLTRVEQVARAVEMVVVVVVVSVIVVVPSVVVPAVGDVYEASRWR